MKRIGTRMVVEFAMVAQWSVTTDDCVELPHADHVSNCEGVRGGTVHQQPAESEFALAPVLRCDTRE